MKRSGTEDPVKISLPYGARALSVELPGASLVFDGRMAELPALQDLKTCLLDRLDHPVESRPLREIAGPGKKILILVEDATRHTPLRELLPPLLDYLEEAGADPGKISLLTAPGTHRMMTPQELRAKLGPEVLERVRLHQHDYNDRKALVDCGTVRAGSQAIPVEVNRLVREADLVIGTGSIVPHADAGFSGGAKILEPGVCGYATTAATHIAAALLDEIPLGVVDNPCRLGIEEAARKAGLDFIINTVSNYRNEVIDIVAGDCVTAHRRGVESSRRAYGVRIPEAADIVFVSSYPADMDWWQAEKGILAAFFAVKPGGHIIFAAPAFEGLAHNHPALTGWLRLTYHDAREQALKTDPRDEGEDLVAADIAMGNSRVREKARIFLVSEGLSAEDAAVLGYRKISSLQEGYDLALAEYAAKTGGPRKKGLSLDRLPTVGVLPRGGDVLPIVGNQKMFL
jgi:nickel-dependent lactate racemase